MGTALTLNAHNVHEIELRLAAAAVPHPSSALFESDPLMASVIGVLRARDSTSLPELQQALAGNFAAEEIAEAVLELKGLQIVAEDGATPTDFRHGPVTRFPLTTVVLNVNTGCNLSCTYCYKEDLATPAKGRRWSSPPRCSRSRCCSRNHPTRRHTTSCSSAASR